MRTSLLLVARCLPSFQGHQEKEQCEAHNEGRRIRLVHFLREVVHCLPPVLRARNLDAQHGLQLRGGDDDARGGDKRSHHRVRHEVCDETEAEDAQQQVRGCNQESQQTGRCHAVLSNVTSCIQGAPCEEAHEGCRTHLDLPQRAEQRVGKEGQERGVEPYSHGETCQQSKGKALWHQHEANSETCHHVARQREWQRAHSTCIGRGMFVAKTADVGRKPCDRRKKCRQLERLTRIDFAIFLRQQCFRLASLKT
mmetsp:Transcript_45302/g.81934  ORF Transcript_45302/g.81934 Transcript_45302/m.81934 type:complete len:253 (+) Transcript_45302:823-1581(+)